MLINRKNSKTKYANDNVKNDIVKGDIVKKYIGHIKNTAPNIHCLTNVVTMQDVANMLLAAGGSAIMAQDIKEVEEITQITSATLLNMGVPSDEKIAAYIKAGKYANELGHPVIFDPVGVGASNYRKNCANEILTNVAPAIIRCNQEEAKVLLGFEKKFDEDVKEFNGEEILESGFAENKTDLSEDKKNTQIMSNGVESSIRLSEDEQEKIARALAYKYDTVAFISGSLDIVSDGKEVLKIDGGDSRMRKVSGTGCMLSALCALFAAGVYAVSNSAVGDNSGSLAESYLYAAYSAGKVWKETAKNTGISTDIEGGGIGTYHCLLFDELEKIMHSNSKL